MNKIKTIITGEYAVLVTVVVVLCATFWFGVIVAMSFEEPTTVYRTEDANRDGVVDLADFSVSVNQLSLIMQELGGKTVPCITQCPFEEPVMPVPLPYQPTE